MILLIDNYDSFTYNLFQYLCELGAEVKVARNDKITPDEIEELAPKRIVVSPGPGAPPQAGISSEVIQRFAGRVRILGVCLGHQNLSLAIHRHPVQCQGTLVTLTNLRHSLCSWRVSSLLIGWQAGSWNTRHHRTQT